MKNIKLRHILGALAIAALAGEASAQDLPKSFNYQAMINAEDGSPIANKNITVEVSILQGSHCDNGGACNVVWQELHEPQTNDFGLFNIEIGSPDAINTMGGTAKKYSDINWLNVDGGDYYMKVRVDFGEATYLNGLTDLGTTKFSAVPYSLVALKCERTEKASTLEADKNGNVSVNLSQMQDVVLQSPSKNQILVFDGKAWKNTDPAAAQGLTNIEINNAQNGQYLVYNATSGNWQNQALPSTNMSELADANISTLNNKDVLLYNLTSKKWVNQPLTLKDVQGLGSPNAGDVITYDGKNWVPKAASTSSAGAGSISELKDVSLSAVQNKQVLSYNSSTLKWENVDNANIWAKQTVGYNAPYKLGIGSDKSVILGTDDDKTDILKLSSTASQGTTHFTGKGMTLGNGANRTAGVGSIALGGGSAIEGTACIGGLSSTIGQYAQNSIVMGVSSSTVAKNCLIIGDNCKTNDVNSYMLGTNLTSIGSNALVIGSFNEKGTDQLFAIGNGSTSGNSTAFYVKKDGSGFSQGTFSHASDQRLKTNITTIESALESVMKMRGVSFYWNKGIAQNANASSDIQYGFVAQEIEKIFPALVTTADNGYKAVNYDGVIPVLTEAIKEQQSEIENLKKENEELKSTLEQLLRRMEALENK